MASTLYCDPDILGREQRIQKAGILGAESPLEFEDGHALVHDEEAADQLVRHSPVEYAGAGNPGDPDYFEEDEEETDEDPETGEEDGGDFDAEAFVDRTPMSDVVEDIESGDYDDHLDAIQAAESDDRERTGVTEAIEARREA